MDGNITIYLNGESSPINIHYHGTTANRSFSADQTIDSLNLSYIGNKPISVWILGSIGGKQDEVFPVARNYTSPFVLQPDTHIVGTVTVTKRQYGKAKWLVYTPREPPFLWRRYSVYLSKFVGVTFGYTGFPDTVTSTSESSSMNLDTSFPASTEWIISEEIVHTSIAGEALKIISTIGGIHVVVNGIFFVIFGRSLLAVLFGMSTYVRPGGEYN